MLTFANSESIKEIYGIQIIGYQVVKIEAIKTWPGLFNVKIARATIMFVAVATEEPDVSDVPASIL